MTRDKAAALVCRLIDAAVPDYPEVARFKKDYKVYLPGSGAYVISYEEALKAIEDANDYGINHH